MSIVRDRAAHLQATHLASIVYTVWVVGQAQEGPGRAPEVYRIPSKSYVKDPLTRRYYYITRSIIWTCKKRIGLDRAGKKCLIEYIDSITGAVSSLQLDVSPVLLLAPSHYLASYREPLCRHILQLG